MKVQILDNGSPYTIILQAVSRAAGWEVHTSGIDSLSSITTFSQTIPDLLLIEEDGLSSDKICAVLKPLLHIKKVQVIVCTNDIVSQKAYNLEQGPIKILDKLFVFTIPWYYRRLVASAGQS